MIVNGYGGSPDLVRRFCDESRGYSEQAADVLGQPGGFAWDVFDDRIAGAARQFEDFRDAERAGAIISAKTVEDLARAMHVPVQTFSAEWREVESLKSRAAWDRFGRHFALDQRCAAPLRAVKVTGALFHTQGGLAIDANARVKTKTGSVFPNLYAAGGAAAGVSGAGAAGYLSGNGLLTATVLGRLAGDMAARHDLRRMGWFEQSSRVTTRKSAHVGSMEAGAARSGNFCRNHARRLGLDRRPLTIIACDRRIADLQFVQYSLQRPVRTRAEQAAMAISRLTRRRFL